MSEFPTLQDLVWAAREKLPRPVWDFVTFGSESETTLRRNRRALDSLAFLHCEHLNPTRRRRGYRDHAGARKDRAFHIHTAGIAAEDDQRRYRCCKRH